MMTTNKMILNIFFIILLLINGSLTQNCQLNATDMDRNWIYAIKPTANSWDVLHTDYIKDQTSLYLICNPLIKTRELFCDHGRLIEKNITKSLNNCTSIRRIKANVVRQTINDNSCRRMNGEIYNIIYTLPEGFQIPLYQVCYSKLNEQALFSKHKSYGFNLAASTYKRPTFTIGTVVSAARASSFKAANIYNRFVELLGVEQTFIPDNKSLILERGHLTNSQDFPTYDQMDETFKYVNVVPQFQGSNRSNWKRIENWVHNLAASNTFAEVVSGMYGTLTLPHSQTQQPIEMYLMPNRKNVIPLWLYKVVKYNGLCYAFVTLNNDFNTDPLISTTICRSVNCPSGLELSSTPGSVAYCCNYNHLVRSVGRHAVLC